MAIEYRVYYQTEGLKKNQMIKISEGFKSKKSAMDYWKDLNCDSIIFARLESREKNKSKIIKELK
jgi:hypothetical protein